MPQKLLADNFEKKKHLSSIKVSLRVTAKIVTWYISLK